VTSLATEHALRGSDAEQFTPGQTALLVQSGDARPRILPAGELVLAAERGPFTELRVLNRVSTYGELVYSAPYVVPPFGSVSWSGGSLRAHE
jgi:hypothetical protein